MPTLDPDDDNLRSLLDGLDIAEPEVANVQKMESRELLARYQQVQRKLTARNELINPETEEGRQLHSEHGAILVELYRRKLR